MMSGGMFLSEGDLSLLRAHLTWAADDIEYGYSLSGPEQVAELRSLAESLHTADSRATRNEMRARLAAKTGSA